MNYIFFNHITVLRSQYTFHLQQEFLLHVYIKRCTFITYKNSNNVINLILILIKTMSRSLMSEITDIFKKRPWKKNGKSIKRFSYATRFALPINYYFDI